MNLRRIALVLWAAALAAAAWLGWRVLLAPMPPREHETFPALSTTNVIEAPADSPMRGHAYKFVAAPNITWNAARDAGMLPATPPPA